LIHVFANALTNPKLVDNAIGKIRSRTESEIEQENPNFRPMGEIIKEAIENYKRVAHQNVTFTRSPDYRSIEHYSATLKGIADRTLLPKTPEEFVEQLKIKLYGEVGNAYQASWSDIQQYSLILTNGSGLNARFVEKYPEMFDQADIPKNFTQYYSLAEEEGKSVMKQIRNLIEKARRESRDPVSSSRILEYFLERNNGELGESLHDTAIALKFLARNDIETGKYSAESNPEKNFEWFSENIQDEFKGCSYYKPPEGESHINLIGKPYHSFNLVSLLKFVPVELIQSATGYEYLRFGDEHGSSKAAADLQTLSDLRNIDSLLLQYSQQGIPSS